MKSELVQGWMSGLERDGSVRGTVLPMHAQSEL